jgi:D-arabinose 1-dehydrogenase-like Zn-dependent alcohol dehydrogenase
MPGCLRGEFWACEYSLTTGISVDGGYAEYMIARSEVLVSIPDELSSIEGAPSFPLKQAAAAYEKMMSAKVHFRAVLQM